MEPAGSIGDQDVVQRRKLAVLGELVKPEMSKRAFVGAFDREKCGRLTEGPGRLQREAWETRRVLRGAGVVKQRKAWITKFDMRSPRYTTRLEEVPVAGKA